MAFHRLSAGGKRKELRYWVWQCLISAVVAVGASPSWSDDALRQRPNIVFIFSDDHAVQALGPYGSTINQTPQLDRLAREGITFDRSFCGNSICGPSRATVLTGKHSHLNGFRRNGDRFDGTQTTFPKLLQQAGYQTALIGKWHLSSDPTGFDYWEILPDQGHYYNPDFIRSDGSRHRREGYCTDLITAMSVEWLESQRQADQPFLLMVQHKAPHRNWSPHPRHFGRYPHGSVPVPATLFDDYSGRTELLKSAEMSLAKHFYWQHDLKFRGSSPDTAHFLDGIANAEYQRMNSAQRAEWDAFYEPENAAFMEAWATGELTERDIVAWKFQRYMHDYLGSVQAVDDSVGELLDYLDRQGLSENTLVVYSSDQGFYLGEHGWYDKRWMFEESLRMPLIVRWPKQIAADTRCSALVQNIDYAPTFLDLCGVEVPGEMQGRSLRRLLEGNVPNDWRDAIYYQYFENDAVHQVPIHDGIRTERYKLMYFVRTGEWQLFDLETDPQELTSVHNHPEYREIFAGVQRRYRDVKAYYQVNTATIPASRGDEDWWKSRQQTAVRAARETQAAIVWFGDSITQGWEGAGKNAWAQLHGTTPALNLGFSGDRTEHVLWRLNQTPWANSRPQAAIVMIGTNNTGHRMQEPAEVAAGIEEIVAHIRNQSPETKVLLLGVFPRGASPWDAGRLNNRAINERIRKLGDEQHVFYRDLDQQFLEPDGRLSPEIMPDYLHLSPAGYQRWADAIKPVLTEWGILDE
ncbi:MAG TPA: sulfatase-like hydrolase/transferase [Pirellulaceae bacterium]|nr:sulfatase-like hydrolase/transferase [Pirellulaceae bacterium]